MLDVDYWGRKTRSRSGRIIALERSDGCCEYCRCIVTQGVNLTFDHRTPKSRGGIMDRHNTMVACTDCNQAKMDVYCEEPRVLLAWLVSMGWRENETL